jgi:mRNA interferase RelE/StbE
MYKVELSDEAQRFYNRCDKPVAKKLVRCLQALEKNPREGNNVKPLKGRFAGSYRYRVGDLCVVYTINGRSVTVFVITIDKRSDALNSAKNGGGFRIGRARSFRNAIGFIWLAIGHRREIAFEVFAPALGGFFA